MQVGKRIDAREIRYEGGHLTGHLVVVLAAADRRRRQRRRRGHERAIVSVAAVVLESAWSGFQGGADVAVQSRQLVDLVEQLRVQRLQHPPLGVVHRRHGLHLAPRRLAARLQPGVLLFVDLSKIKEKTAINQTALTCTTLHPSTTRTLQEIRTTFQTPEPIRARQVQRTKTTADGTRETWHARVDHRRSETSGALLCATPH